MVNDTTGAPQPWISGGRFDDIDVQAAATPPGRYAACFLGETSPACSLNAGTFAQSPVALCPENKTLEGKTAAGVKICCMDLSLDLSPGDGLGLRAARILGDPA